MEDNIPQPDALDNTQLEAKLLRQEHRLFKILFNYFRLRHTFANDDPRRDACAYAFFFRLAYAFLPTAATASIGITSIVALVISFYSLTYLRSQNKIETRAALFAHALEIHKGFIDHPDLVPYFYDGVPAPEKDKETNYRIRIVCEMLADMIDHAAASDPQNLSDEGWANYAQDMYENSPAFHDFFNSKETREWYPSIGRWVTFDPIAE